jgi:hypothetical protein
MSDMSNYMETASYDFWFRPGASAPTRPTSHTVSLWSAVVDGEAGTGTELTNGTSPGYARAAVTFGSSTNGAGSNSAQVLWAIASGDWIQATHYGIHDHLGNLLQTLKALPSPITVTTGNRAVSEVGDLQLAMA